MQETASPQHKRGEWMVYGIIALLFFGFTSIHAFLGPHGFSSPDEEVNIAAATAFAKTGSFAIKDALPEDTAGIVKPRNIQVVNGAYVPLSFLGFPLFLAAADVVGGNIGMLLLTPLLATAALLGFAYLAREVWGKRVALLATLLLATTPAWLFFSFKGLWHNVAFTSLLVLAAVLVRIAARHRKGWLVFCGGIVAGFALEIRTIELAWVAVALFALCLLVRMPWRHMLLVGVGLLVGFAPIFFLNVHTFGDPLSFGYTEALERSHLFTEQTPFFERALRFIAPVAPSIKLYLTNIQWYGFMLTPWLTLFAVLGILAVFFRPFSRSQRIWVLGMGLIGAWLFYFYGGNPYYGSSASVAVPIIGASLNRYLLPFLVLLVPVIAFGLYALADVMHIGKKTRATLILVCVFLSLQLVFFEPESGLVEYVQDGRSQDTTARQVVDALPNDAVVIAGKKDKFFFPERITMGYNDLGDQQLQILPALLAAYPVYYNDIAARDLVRLNTAGEQYGYQLTQVGTVGQDPLYRFIAE